MNETIEQTPPVEAPLVPEPQPIEETSVAAHAAKFGPNATRDEEATPEAPGGQTAADRARDQQGRFTQQERERHRAKSQLASPDDVKVIGELTKELRETEAALAKVKPGTESPRVSALRRQIRGLKAELDEAQPKPAAAPQQPVQPQQPRQAPQAPTQPSAPDKKPTWSQFEGEIGTKFQSWGEAQDAYYDAQRAWTVADAAQQQAQQQQVQGVQQAMTAYTARVNEFIKVKPDFQQKLQAAMSQDNDVPAPLFHAFVSDDNGPQLLYHLLEHPDQLDEMRLLATSLPPTDSSVALLRRRLHQLSRAQAVNTGSVVATPHVIAPRPPNPVRTGPMKAGDEPPGEGHSIAEHQKHWGPQPRR